MKDGLTIATWSQHDVRSLLECGCRLRWGGIRVKSDRSGIPRLCAVTQPEMPDGRFRTVSRRIDSLRLALYCPAGPDGRAVYQLEVLDKTGVCTMCVTAAAEDEPGQPVIDWPLVGLRVRGEVQVLDATGGEQVLRRWIGRHARSNRREIRLAV